MKVNVHGYIKANCDNCGKDKLCKCFTTKELKLRLCAECFKKRGYRDDKINV